MSSDGERGKPSTDPRWSEVDMSPRAKRHYEKYLRWLKRDYAEAESTVLVVLIWGPGAGSGADLFEKREEIRGRLRERGDVALFSEELDEVCRSFSSSTRVRELFQARRADLVVALYGSPGSIAEVHDMASVLGTKMLTFVDSRHAGSYGATGLLAELKSRFNAVEYFEYPKDIEECNLMGAVEAKLHQLRIAKWWAMRQGVHI